MVVDWTPFKFQPFALRAVARLSGRAFVGTEINRKEEWMDTSINFAMHVFVAVVKLQMFPEWLRPVSRYFVKELRQIQRDIDKAGALLRPVIEERLRDLDLPCYEQPPDDLIQWLVETLPEHEKGDYQMQAQLQLVLAAASIHTTNNLLTDCMYDLAAHPEVQEMLRQEAIQVLEVEGGWAKKDSMAKLKKMDSFIKEVQRFSGNISMSSVHHPAQSSRPCLSVCPAPTDNS
jgi:cytochrome P450